MVKYQVRRAKKCRCYAQMSGQKIRWQFYRMKMEGPPESSFVVDRIVFVCPGRSSGTYTWSMIFLDQDLPSGAISAQAAALLAPPPKPPPDDDPDGVTGFDGFLLLPSEMQWTPFLIFFGCQVFQMFNNCVPEVVIFLRKWQPEVEVWF